VSSLIPCVSRLTPLLPPRTGTVPVWSLLLPHPSECTGDMPLALRLACYHCFCS